jgi:cytochrome oxidase assembly protein ShyY1
VRFRGQRYEFHFSWLPFSVALVASLLCLKLAYWQFQRAEGKQQQLNFIGQMQQQGRLTLAQFDQLPSDWEKTGTEVTLSGYFLPEIYWLLDNAVVDGQVGYDVIALFNVSDSSTGITSKENEKPLLLVNLGWVKAPSSRDQLPSVQLPSQALTLSAQIKTSPNDRFVLSDEQESFTGWPKRIQSVDTAKMQAESQHPVRGILAFSQSEIDGFRPHYQAVVMGSEKHTAYAVQWLLIALAAVVIYLAASLQKLSTETIANR